MIFAVNEHERVFNEGGITLETSANFRTNKAAFFWLILSYLTSFVAKHFHWLHIAEKNFWVIMAAVSTLTPWQQQRQQQEKCHTTQN